MKGGFDLLTQTATSIETVVAKIKEVVKEVIQENNLRSGSVILQTLEDKLDELSSNIVTTINDKVAQCQRMESNVIVEEDFESQQLLLDVGPAILDVTAERDNGRLGKYFVYAHPDGMFYDVPFRFSFPKKTNRRNGWDILVAGQPSYQFVGNDRVTYDAPVRPFHFIKSDRLPKALKAVFRTNWRPIFTLMQGEDPVALPEGAELGAFLESTYNTGTVRIKTKCPYI